LFCPQITTATEARIYGVSYILTARGGKGPTGARRVGTVGGEALYHVSGSGQATLSALPAPGQTVPVGAPGQTVPVTHPSPASVRLVTDSATPRLLRLRVTALPGWHATIDGRSLALEHWATGAMLEARVPAGHHVIELQYWPGLFSAGLVIAAAVLAGFVAVAVLAFVRRGARARS
jgi:hypothetical protein